MSQPALTVTVDIPIEQAVRLMESHHVHRLVVVDEDGQSPIGILSATDLVRSIGGGVADRLR